MTTKEEILQLVWRSLMLNSATVNRVKSEIDILSEERLEELLFTLREVDEKQTEILKEKLKEEPWLFTKMEWKISQEVYKKHIAEEREELKTLEEKFVEFFKKFFG